MVSASLLAAALGCGPAGPSVRVAPGSLEWKPAKVLVPPARVSGKALEVARGLPADISRPADSEVSALAAGELAAAVNARSGPEAVVASPALADPGVSSRIEQLSRQYGESRTVDPRLASGLEDDIAEDAVLLCAVLRYGPEAEGEPEQSSQRANPKIGETDIAISATTTRTVVYLNAHIRCALVRVSDGAIVWDASIRRREKRGLLADRTQESLLRDAVIALVSAFPYGGASGRDGGAAGP